VKRSKLVVPLAVFGPRGEDPFRLTREQLSPLVNVLSPEVRRRVGRYLRSGTTVFPIMGYTEDVLGGKFGVSGGIAIVTDGVYYWRQDAADYVEHYGIGLPEDQVEHMRRSSWRAAPLDDRQIAAIDKFLCGKLRDQ